MEWEPRKRGVPLLIAGRAGSRYLLCKLILTEPRTWVKNCRTCGESIWHGASCDGQNEIGDGSAGFLDDPVGPVPLLLELRDQKAGVFEKETGGFLANHSILVSMLCNKMLGVAIMSILDTN